MSDVDHAGRPGAGMTDRLFGFVSLFSSFGTLTCCALPALLVLFGLGAAVASVLSAAPWLVWLSRRKDWVFAGSGTLIALNVAYVCGLAPRRRQAAPTCPPGDAAACTSVDRLTRFTLWSSGILYVVGFITAYLLGPMLEWWTS